MSELSAIHHEEFDDSLLADFLDESGQLLGRLNEDLLQLDEWLRSLDDSGNHRCDDELLNDMFRAAHSLKGLSAMLGLKDINTLTHKVENVFDAARKDQLSVTGDVVELIFQAVDRLGGLVDVLKSPDAEAVDCESVVEGIARLLESAGADRKQSSQADAENLLAELEVPPAAPTECPLPPTASEPDVFAGLVDEQEVVPKYLSIFIDECEQSLDNLTETLLASEEGQNGSTAARLMIVAHRIKGAAASIGLNRSAKLAHLMEDALQEHSEQSNPLASAVTDALLACTDGLRRYVEGLKHGNASTEDFPRLAGELIRAWQGADRATADATSPAASIATSPIAVPSDAIDASGTTRSNAAVPAGLHVQVAAVSSDHEATLVGVARFDPGLPLVGLKAQLIWEKMSSLGDVCHFHPPVETLDQCENIEELQFGLVSARSAEEVHRHLWVAGLERLVIERLMEDGPNVSPMAVQAGDTTANAEPVAAKPAPANRRSQPNGSSTSDGAAEPCATRGNDSGSKPMETIRVDIERLDQLMNLAGQLVINKARFAQIGDKMKGAVGNRHSEQTLEGVMHILDRMQAEGDDSRSDPQATLAALRSQSRRARQDLDAIRRDVESLAQVRGSLNDLLESIHQLDRISDAVQQGVMDTRMLPIGPLFTRFKRVIRDITRANGKNIQLIIRGEKTELDKRMIDDLGDPLIHLVRNSADHGIESPEVREASGKPLQGTVTLDAFHRGNSIIIQVSDDGKGLDVERIRRKAIEKGLISEADSEKMTPRQIAQLIWAPGLTTAAQVTDISGRGMGMDIVKSKIEDLNGVVELESEPGRGTTFTIKLPLTLAILPSLMIEIERDMYAMPLESVLEIVRVDRKELTTVQGRWMAKVRNRVISVVRLGDVFAWGGATADTGDPAEGDVTLVIVSGGGHEIAVVVDRVVGEEDVVIKSMAENYRNVLGIAGASILGDGRVSLILDLAALIDMASKRARNQA